MTRRRPGDVEGVESALPPGSEVVEVEVPATIAEPVSLPVAVPVVEDATVSEPDPDYLPEDATPTTLAQILDWVATYIDYDDVTQAVRPWFGLLTSRGLSHPKACEWIQDATTRAIGAEGPKRYANALIQKWLDAGGRPSELAAKEAEENAAKVVHVVQQTKDQKADEERRRQEEDERLERAWDRLPTLEQDRIEKHVLDVHPHAKRFTARFLRAACIAEMENRQKAKRQPVTVH